MEWFGVIVFWSENQIYPDAQTKVAFSLCTACIQ